MRRRTLTASQRVLAMLARYQCSVQVTCTADGLWRLLLARRVGATTGTVSLPMPLNLPVDPVLGLLLIGLRVHRWRGSESAAAWWEQLGLGDPSTGTAAQHVLAEAERAAATHDAHQLTQLLGAEGVHALLRAVSRGHGTTWPATPPAVTPGVVHSSRADPLSHA